MFQFPSEVNLPEGLGELSTYVQLRGGWGTDGVVVAQRRVFYEVRKRYPAAVCGRRRSSWAATEGRHQ